MRRGKRQKRGLAAHELVDRLSGHARNSYWSFALRRRTNIGNVYLG
jgi:hypothetical protein